MSQPAPVSSPCIGVCQLDEVTGYCMGCLRTLDEIAAWSEADDGQRRHILAQVRDRRRRGYRTAPPPRQTRAAADAG